MRITTGIILGLLTFSPPAHSQAIANYAAWQNLSQVQKRGYVMGSYDSYFSTVHSFGNADAEANIRGVHACRIDMKFTDVMLVQLVETFYVQKPPKDWWAIPPSGVLFAALLGLCETYRNNVRVARGLPLIPK
jgi:hypothetical protein